MEINDIDDLRTQNINYSSYERFERLALSKNLLPNPYTGPK